MRAVLAALLTAFAVVFVAVELFSIPVSGKLPGYVQRRIDQSRGIILAVSPDAAGDGLRAGDRYDWAAATSEQRKLRFRAARPGDAIVLPVVRDGALHPVTLTARPLSPRDRIAALCDVLLKIIGIAIGIVLVVRGKGRFGLFAGLAVAGLALGEGFGVPFTALSPALGALMYAVDSAIIALCALWLTTEAMLALCAQYLRPAEIVLFRGVAIAAALVILANGTDLLAVNLAGTNLHVSREVFYAAELAYWFAVGGYLVALLRAARPDRQLVAWMFCSTLFGITGPTVNVVLALAGTPAPFFGALNLTLFAGWFGYAYVALRYRIVDVSFVLNRALVYGAVIALVVGVLSIAETLLAKLAVGTRNSLALEIVTALVLGFSIRPIERRIDAVVERVLFSRKHAAEEALRALIADCAHVEEPAMLLANVCAEARRVMEASFVAVYERVEALFVPIAWDPPGTAPITVSIDDAVVVRMRSALAPVDLGTLRSALGGEGIAFPMLTRGRMLGALVCGPKPGRRAYDPDERALLAQLSHETGTSLLFLRTTAPAPREIPAAI